VGDTAREAVGDTTPPHPGPPLCQRRSHDVTRIDDSHHAPQSHALTPSNQLNISTPRLRRGRWRCFPPHETLFTPFSLRKRAPCVGGRRAAWRSPPPAPTASPATSATRPPRCPAPPSARGFYLCRVPAPRAAPDEPNQAKVSKMNQKLVIVQYIHWPHLSRAPRGPPTHG
jgi:hypothetical protein